MVSAIHRHEPALGARVFPHSEPASYLHPRIPLGSPRAPALSALLHASSVHRPSALHIIYMFQCYSLKSSHPRLLPQSPKVYSLHLCLFACLAYRIIITIFLNSNKFHTIHCISVSFSDVLHSV